MEEKNLTNRIQNFNKNFYGREINQETAKNKLINAREKSHLQMRKNKIDEEIMKNRMMRFIKNAHANANIEKYSNLTIKIEELLQFLPDYFNDEFNNYDDKFEKIREFLNGHVKDMSNNLNSCDVTTEAYLRYALVKLRDMSMVWDINGGIDVDIDADLIENLITILFSHDDIKIQYEITHILINLTYDTKEFTDYLIEEEFVKKLFSMTYVKEPGLVYHVIWIFANLTDTEEMSNILLTILPDLPERLIDLMMEYSNVFMHLELLNNIAWLIYRLLRCNTEEFMSKIEPAIPDILNLFVEEVKNLFLFNGYGGISVTSEIIISGKNKYENGFIDNLLLVIYKITQLTDKDEILTKFITPNFLNSIMRLFPEPLLLENFNLVHVFRIIGCLLSTSNSSEIDTILTYGYVEKVEKLLEIYMLHCNENNNINININQPNEKYDAKILSAIALSISNITAGTESHVARVILKSKLPSYFLNISQSLKSSPFIKEVLYIFFNAFDFGSQESQKAILNDHLFALLIDAFSLQESNKELVKFCLDFLLLIFDNTKIFIDVNMYNLIKRKFESMNIIAILNKLINHNNKDISDLAELIFFNNWNYCDENGYL